MDTKAPVLTAEIPWSDFSPNGNGSQKNIPVSIKECSSEKLWTADVRDEKDRTIRSYTWNGIKENIVWDGSDESGNMSPDGKYNLVIYSTDDAGNSFQTELKGITLDNRETKGYITAEYDGISPNADNFLDSQKFEITTTVGDSILSWNFDVRKEDGTSVFSLSQADSSNLPANITWNGVDKDGNVC